MKSKQLSLFPRIKPQFGGSLLLNKRKSKRPLATKLPIHIIIKSEKAKGRLSFVAHQQKLLNLISRTAQKYKIRVFDKAVNFDHIHLVLQLPNLTSYSPWIREFTAKIVMLLQVTTKQKLHQFFNHRPFTRIVTWGRDFRGVMQYQVRNQLEIVGLRPPKKKKLKKKTKPPCELPCAEPKPDPNKE